MTLTVWQHVHNRARSRHSGRDRRFGGTQPVVQRFLRRAAFEHLENRLVLTPLPPLASYAPFDAIDYDMAAAATGEVAAPTDVDGALGRGYWISVAGGALHWRSRLDDTAQIQPLAAPDSGGAGFFDALDPAGPVGGAKVAYDRDADRYIVAALERLNVGADNAGNISRILVAASAAGDPTGAWQFLAVDAREHVGVVDTWADNLGLTVNGGAIFLAASLRSFAPTTDRVAARLWVVDAAAFYGGADPLPTKHNPYGNIATTEFPPLVPAEFEGTSSAPRTFLVGMGKDGEIQENMFVIGVDNALSSLVFRPRIVSIADADGEQPLVGAPQAGSTNPIPTGATIVADAVWRDNRLYVVQTTLPAAGSEAGQESIRWYRFNATLMLATLEDNGVFGGESLGVGTRVFDPAISVDADGTMTITFQASNAAMFPSLYAVSREPTDPGSSVRDPVPIFAGMDAFSRTQPSGASVWTTGNALAIDPADNTTLWALAQRSLARGSPSAADPLESGRWAARWATVDTANVNNVVRGRKYEDLNGNGLLDSSERGVPGWTVYLDANGNGQLDADELRTVTRSDDPTTSNDEGGEYEFRNVPQGDYTVRFLPLAGWTSISPNFVPHVAFGPTQLTAIRSQLAARHTEVTGPLVNRFDFTGGETGTSILDGGNDMYDGGNILGTNIAGAIPYTNGQVLPADSYFGPGSHYFTAKHPGMFALGVSNMNVDYFQIDGETGADGAGMVEATNSTFTIGTRQWRVYAKRTRDTGDPSIHQLIIVPANASQTFFSSTNSDHHRLASLSSMRELYYVLLAGRIGTFFTNAELVDAARRFMSALPLPAGTSIDFGDRRSSKIDGIVFEDRDKNGLFDANDRGVSGWQLYVDLNANGVQDAGEPAALSRIDDPATAADDRGRFEISPLPTGKMTLRLNADAGWIPTGPPNAVAFTVAPIDLAASRTSIAANAQAIVERIGARFDFSEGETGKSIADGGGVFADGNILATDLADEILYTSGELAPGDAIFGPGSSYFTTKHPGLFALSADNIAIDSFSVGGTTAASYGLVEGSASTIYVGGEAYALFVKRIYAGDAPAINHLFVVRGPSQGLNHAFSTDPTSDADEIGGLAQASELHYLLTTLDGGAYLTDLAAQALARDYLAALVRRADPLGPVLFGNHPNATISGYHWNDLNGNRLRDSGEPGLGGWTVFIDANDNGQLDAGERSTETAFDDPETTQVDETGYYEITGLAHDTFYLGVVPQDGWGRTFPLAPTQSVRVGTRSAEGVLAALLESGQSLSGLIPDRHDFSDGVTGTSIGDGGGDMYDTGNQLVATRLGTNRTVSYSNNLVQFGSDRFGPQSTYFTSKLTGLFVFGASQVEVDSFRIQGGLGADGAGQFETGQFALAAGGQLYTVYIKRVYGAGDPSVNHILLVPGGGDGITRTVGTTTDSDLHRLDGLASTREIYYLLFSTNGGTRAPDEIFQSLATAFLDLLPAGLSPTAINFGSRETVNNGVISGSIWNDLDRDGVRDGNEPGMTGWQVYLDTNDNGRHDAGEPIVTVRNDDPTTIGIDEAGTYDFVGLTGGAYVVTALPPATDAVTSPAMNYQGRRDHRLILAEGQIVGGIHFAGKVRRGEMRIRGLSVEVIDGDPSTYLQTGTYFSIVDLANEAATSTFVIYNVGDAPLQLTGNPPVEITGAAAADFAVATQPALTVLAPGMSTTFAVRFDPSQTGTRRATVSIEHTDMSASPFTFAIEGLGRSSTTLAANNDTFTMSEDTILDTGFSTVVPLRSSWRYFEDMRRTGPAAAYPTDSTSGASFYFRSYNTSFPSFGAWKGPSQAPFAAGVIDAFQSGTTQLTDAFIPSGGSTAVTALFRTNFTLDAAGSLSTTARVRALCDDACIGYINGVEIFRERLPAGTISPTAEATEVGNESEYLTYTIDLIQRGVPLFADGNNVFAVEVHQHIQASTDFGFDASLSLAGGMTNLLTNDLRTQNAAVSIISPPYDVTTGQRIGRLVLASDNSGNFSFTPPVDYAGVVRFRYLLSDGSQNNSSGIATIVVAASNDPPKALDDAYSGRADRQLIVAAGAPLVEASKHPWWYDNAGSNQDLANPTWKFGPAAGFDPGAAGWWGPSPGEFGYGDDDERTLVRLDAGLTSRTDFFYSTFAVSGNPEQLIVELKRDDGAAVYINGVEVITDNLPVPHPFDTFALSNTTDDGKTFHRYVISTAGLDLLPSGNTIAVQVHQWDTTSTDMSFDLRIYDPTLGLLANDEDRDHPASNLFVANVTPAFDPQTVGTLEVNPNGSFVFTPANAAVNGNFTFTYQVRDSAGLFSAPATVTLSITATDLGPVIAADDLAVPQFTTMEDTPLVIDAATGPAGPIGIGLLANDQHPGEESSPLSLEITRQPTSGGTVILSATEPGGFTYTPGADFDGIDSFSYRVFDGVAFSNEALVNVIVQSVDDPPVAVDDEYSVEAGASLDVVDPSAGVLANDYDVDEDSLDAADIVPGQEPQHGTIAFNADGTFNYTPNVEFIGTDQFQYVVRAGGVWSTPATVSIHVVQSSCAPNADLNGDGAVDLADLAVFVAEYGAAQDASRDFDCDGFVGLSDLIRLRDKLAGPAPAPAGAIVATARSAAAIDAALDGEAITAAATVSARSRRQADAPRERSARRVVADRLDSALSDLAVTSLAAARASRRTPASSIPKPTQLESHDANIPDGPTPL